MVGELGIIREQAGNSQAVKTPKQKSSYTAMTWGGSNSMQCVQQLFLLPTLNLLPFRFTKRSSASYQGTGLKGDISVFRKG